MKHSCLPATRFPLSYANRVAMADLEDLAGEARDPGLNLVQQRNQLINAAIKKGRAKIITGEFKLYDRKLVNAKIFVVSN